METKNQAWLEKGLGKQLLKKMGWKEGEGLGADGQGRKANVSVAKAVEQRGLGFSSAVDVDSGTVRQIQGLDEVLSALRTEHTATPEPSTKKSKKRVHKEEKKDEAESSSDETEVKPKRVKRKRGYQKFLDAKDVSLYSKQDLKAILGGIGDA